MTNEKRLLYRKAYVELYEIIKRLSKEEQDKIPNVFMDNLVKSKDSSYSFEFDESKGIFEQDLMVETQALLVGIYEKYLAPESEKELWEKYDRFCLNKIEEKRREKYNPDEIFKNKEVQKVEEETQDIENNLPVEVKREKFFERLIGFIKRFLKK